MKQLILNNKPIMTFDRTELKDFYINQGYDVIDVIYSGNFIKPIWNGIDFIEGATPEEIAEQELEQQKILKQQQYEELLETDWYVVRFVETGIPVPEEILQQRQAIRNKYN